ncbi:MAG: cysteine desulfurase NifS [Ruminococcaceae bacterium]|nr:cysteine desulfurase NifS [Oscillospiraceae bacterium]
MSKFVYADNAATTKVSHQVINEMVPYLCENYGNPSSLYSKGREAKAALENAREKIASLIGCQPKELYFTSCGSESDNWAIRGIAERNAAKGKHIITSAIEHHAVLHTMKALEKKGYEVTYLGVGTNGIVDVEEFRKAIRPDTILATVMYANNEIGTIQPIKELCEIAHENKIPFFTDAVQAVGHVDIDVNELGVDMLSFSGHKFGAPKGIGALYIKSGTLINNLVEGGGQEKRKRAGTENVAGIVAMAKALELALKNGKAKRAYIKNMRDKLIDGLLEIPYTRLNGDRDNRLPGNVNVSIEFIEGESLILWLDIMGICVSTGSACSTASLDPSHVLLAIGLPHEVAHGSLRISINEDNTPEECDYILECVKNTVEKLRAMSPLYNK